jgi:hypothetical protein
MMTEELDCINRNSQLFCFCPLPPRKLQFSRIGSRVDDQERFDAAPGIALWIAEPNEIQFRGVVHLNNGHQNKHVHYVMRIEEKVESTRKPSLRDPHRPDETAQNRYGVL